LLMQFLGRTGNFAAYPGAVQQGKILPPGKQRARWALHRRCFRAVPLRDPYQNLVRYELEVSFYFVLLFAGVNTPAVEYCNGEYGLICGGLRFRLWGRGRLL
jgi:hypothetical protein